MSALAVFSIGASTPIGIDARQTSLFLRAAKAAPRTSPFRDGRGNSFGSIRCQWLDDALIGRERFVALAKPALEEALENLPPSMRREYAADRPVVLLLALPEPCVSLAAPSGPGAGEDNGFGAEVLGAIAKSAGLLLDKRSEAIQLGHAGFGAVLARAAMFAGDVQVIVGAVDSYHDPDRMKGLDDNYRLLSERGTNGFIPSEGASFACVAPLGRRTAADKPLSIVRFVACAEEEVPFPAMAHALTKLTRDERLPRPVPWALSDMNGENHREREWTFTRMRNSDVFHHDRKRTVIDNLYSEIGELGAASGAVYLAYVSTGFSLGFAPGRSALVMTSSEGKARAIFFVEAPE